MPVGKNTIITGPNIDKLAEGLYAAEITALTNTVKNLKGVHLALRTETRQLRKQLRGALKHQETLLQHLADSRAARERLLRENKRFKAQLLNSGITPLEDK